jgi:bifunctional enzyme CysN/CysC
MTAASQNTVYKPSDLIADDIDAYLVAHQHKTLLRFITCGSVDDGKSTLIGRLLYDSKMIFEDQMAALEADSKRVGTQGGATPPATSSTPATWSPALRPPTPP